MHRRFRIEVWSRKVKSLISQSLSGYQRWKWIVLILLVADFWGMWFLSYSASRTTLSRDVRYPGNVPYAAAQDYLATHDHNYM
jgi:hypothetical protein